MREARVCVELEVELHAEGVLHGERRDELGVELEVIAQHVREVGLLEPGVAERVAQWFAKGPVARLSPAARRRTSPARCSPARSSPRLPAAAASPAALQCRQQRVVDQPVCFTTALLPCTSTIAS